MKVFLLDVVGTACALRVSEFGGAVLTPGARLRVDAQAYTALRRGAFSPYLQDAGTEDADTLQNHHWEFAVAPEATTDLQQVARNMSMAGKPGRRHKIKRLG